MTRLVHIHVLGEAIEVLTLLVELLAERKKLLLLALADGVILVGLLAALEGITTRDERLSQN